MTDLLIGTIAAICIILACYLKYVLQTRLLPSGVRQARRLMASDREKAMKMLMSVLSVDRSNTEANWLMAAYYRSTDQYVLAQMYLHEILSYGRFTRDVSPQAVREELADLLYRMGEFGKAMAQYSLLEREDSISPVALKRAVRMKMQTGSFSEARRFVQSGLKMYPEDGEFFFLDGMVDLGTGRFILAESAFVSAGAAGYRSPELDMNLGKAYFINGKFEPALRALQNVPEGILRSSELENLLGQCFFHLKNFSAAIMTLEKYLPAPESWTQKEDLDTAFILGCAYELSGGLSRGMEIWRSITARFPYYSNAAQKLDFYGRVAVSEEMRNLLFTPSDAFRAKVSNLLFKMGYQIKEKLYEDEKVLDLLCSYTRDVNPFNCYMVDVRRQTSPVTVSLLAKMMAALPMNRARYLVMIAPQFDAEAISAGRRNMVPMYDMSIFGEYGLIPAVGAGSGSSVAAGVADVRNPVPRV